MLVKGVSGPSACANAIAIAVLPVPGCPAKRTALPAIFPVNISQLMKLNAQIKRQTSIKHQPSLIICKMMPAARRAGFWPTMPWEIGRGSKESSRPSPRIWEWAPIRSMRVMERTSVTWAGAKDWNITSKLTSSKYYKGRSVDAILFDSSNIYISKVWYKLW